MRYGIKVAYDGSLFHGSQRQGSEDALSVEGAILEALKRMGQHEAGGPHPIEFSSRTDAGVSSLGNVFAIETDMDPGELLKGLNANLEGIWCIAYGRMREGQNIRWANSRWYRYHLPPGEITGDRVKDLNDALSEYVGRFDFTNLCRLEEGKDPVVQIDLARAQDLSGRGDLVIIDMVGGRFLWNQVRRMVGAALAVARGDLERELLAELLKGPEASDKALKVKDRIRTMPPTGLVLMDVIFKDIDFTIHPGAVEIARKRSHNQAWEASMKVLLHTALRSLL